MSESNLSPEFEAKLNSIYAKCLDQIRTIAALDPTKPVEDWDKYTCTCAHEFALDLAHAWDEHASDGGDGRTFDVVRGTGDPFTEWLRGREHRVESVTSYITYGLVTFGNVLRFVEAIRAGRFDPAYPGGIRA